MPARRERYVDEYGTEYIITYGGFRTSLAVWGNQTRVELSLPIEAAKKIGVLLKDEHD